MEAFGSLVSGQSASSLPAARGLRSRLDVEQLRACHMCHPQGREAMELWTYQPWNTALLCAQLRLPESSRYIVALGSPVEAMTR
jgi:hypothetical protein